MTPLHRETRGHGTLPLTLLHGWSLNLRVFDDLCDLLGDVAQCTAVDLPGHGRSTAPWQEETLLSQLEASLPGKPGVLLGWSLGAQLALQLAARAGTDCRALVLLCGSARFVAESADHPGMAPATAALFRDRLLADVAGAQRDFLELQVRGSQQAAATQARLRTALDSHGRATADALHASLDHLYRNDLRSLLPTVRVPSLVIAGQYDRVTHPSAARALAQALPDARYLEVPRAGHAPFLSHAPVVADAIREFLAVHS
jgi:pimeloyl-[acyl-carrier protein] methyl ester esterase